MDSGLSASDVLALNRNNDGMFGGDGWWIVLLLLFAVEGGLWGNNRNDYITSPQFESANQFQALDRQLSGITYGIADSTFALNNAITGVGYRDLENFSTLRYENALGNKDIISAIQSCCCETQKAIHAEGETTRGLIQENKIEALRDKVHALELQAAVGNVVRYPTSYSYSAGPSPFCYTPCGGNANI
jgi:hypothetical protein